jgi:hypothetical protein
MGIPAPPISPYIKLFFNLVVYVILYFVLSSFEKITGWNPCIPSSVSVVSASMIVLVVFHLAVQTFGIIFTGAVVFGFPVSSIMDFLKRIHLWRTPDIFSWGVAIMIILACVYSGFFPRSPLLINNPPPRIIDFTVQFQEDGRMMVVQSGRTIDIESNEIILVTANVPGSQKITCDWMAINGHLGDAEGCATRYRPPQLINQDALTALANTSCSDGTAFRGLSVNIVPYVP